MNVLGIHSRDLYVLTWIYYYSHSICAVGYQTLLNSYVNVRMHLAWPIQLDQNHSQATFTFSQRGPWYNSKWSCEAVQRATHIYSAPHITLPYQIASQIKSFQLQSQKNHRGSKAVQSCSVTVWIAYKGWSLIERSVHNVFSSCLRGEDPLPPEDRQRQDQMYRPRYYWVIKRNMLYFNSNKFQET